MKLRSVALASILLVAVLGGLFAAQGITISSIPEPGKAEIYLAKKLKHFLVYRGSRQVTQPAASNLGASVAEGDKLYGVECASCHGIEGTQPSDAGRWMYPRAANLGSEEIREYSDVELFWIVKNGIRLSGMPAFGRVESEKNIWSLVQYVRSLSNGERRTSVTDESNGDKKPPR